MVLWQTGGRAIITVVVSVGLADMALRSFRARWDVLLFARMIITIGVKVSNHLAILVADHRCRIQLFLAKLTDHDPILPDSHSLSTKIKLAVGIEPTTSTLQEWYSTN